MGAGELAQDARERQTRGRAFVLREHVDPPDSLIVRARAEREAIDLVDCNLAPSVAARER